MNPDAKWASTVWTAFANIYGTFSSLVLSQILDQAPDPLLFTLRAARSAENCFEGVSPFLLTFPAVRREAFGAWDGIHVARRKKRVGSVVVY